MLWLKISGRAASTTVERVRNAAEVGCQHFDRAAGDPRVDRLDHARPVPRAAVGQVVAIDRGDHRVAQPHRRDRLGDVLGLARRRPRRRPSRGHGAEAAAAGADVAEDHEASPCRARPSTRRCWGSALPGRRCGGSDPRPACGRGGTRPASRAESAARQDAARGRRLPAGAPCRRSGRATPPWPAKSIRHPPAASVA